MNKLYYIVSKTFPAFRGRDFRLFFYGQLISWIGTWLQNVALGWFVWKTTHSELWVGAVAAIPLFIASVLNPLGGIIADRFDKRKVLYVTNVLEMTQAFVLGWLAIHNTAPLWVVVTLSFLLGVVTAVDGPTRNSFIPEIVRREEIRSGAAMSAAMITAAQAFGPALAALLIPIVGIGWTFILNGISFLAVFITLVMMRVENKSPKHVEHPWKMFKTGVSHAISEERTRLCLILTCLIAMLGFSYRAILPVITTEMFKSGPQVLGYLTAVVGLGACLGAMIVSAKSEDGNFNKLIILGTIMTGASLVAFSANENLIVGLTLLFVAGLGFTLSFSTARAELQFITEEKMRGRITGITMMVFLGGLAFGNFLDGVLSKRYGCAITVSSNGIAMLLLTATVALSARRPEPASE